MPKQQVKRTSSIEGIAGRVLMRRRKQVHIKFMNPFHKELESNVVVPTNSVIGNIVTHLPSLKHIKALRVLKDKTYLGYDYYFDKKLSDYPNVFDGTVKVWLHGHLDVHQAQFNIEHPLKYFLDGQAWPPAKAVNWADGDPINLGPFLTWIGWGRGPTIMPREEDNNWEHLIVLKYPCGVTKVVNFFSYLKAVVCSNLRDPLTNKKWDQSGFKRLFQSNMGRGELLPICHVAYDESA